MNRDYENYICYNRLNDKQKEVFLKLVNFYGEKINADCFIGQTVYTNHDFDHHCNDVLKILSQIVLNNAPLTSKQWFMLDVAVLFHDFSMVRKIPSQIERNTHSRDSAKKLREIWDDARSPFRVCCSNENLLNSNEVDLICEMIKSHSDVKDKNNPIPDEINGLNNPRLSLSDDYNSLGLAAALRLADELDISQARIGNEYCIEDIKDGDEDQRFSYSCWEALHYCQEILINPQTSNLIYICYDDEIERIMAKKNSPDYVNTIMDQIRKTIKKINETIELTNEKAFRHKECSNWGICFNKIEFASKKIFLDYYDDLHTEHKDKKHKDLIDYFKKKILPYDDYDKNYFIRAIENIYPTNNYLQNTDIFLDLIKLNIIKLNQNSNKYYWVNGKENK